MCVFNWEQDCIQGTELKFSSMSVPLSTTPFQCLSADGVSSVHFVNSENCWIKQYKVQEGRLLRSPNQVAQAAATVAMGQYNVSLSPTFSATLGAAHENCPAVILSSLKDDIIRGVEERNKPRPF